MDIAFKSQSWQPTERNVWIIKFSIFNDDMEKFEYHISVEEAENATYSIDKECWEIGDINITLFKLY